MQTLRHHDNCAFALVVKARQQGVIVPLIHSFSLAVRQSVDRLERIIDDDDVATTARQRAVDRCGKAKAVSGRGDLDLRILYP